MSIQFRMEIRNRKQPQTKKEEKKVEAILYNENDWDFAAIARKRMQFVQINDPGLRFLQNLSKILKTI